MGEAANMMLEGILDENGEYTGMDLGYTYQHYSRNNPLGGVRNFVIGKFGRAQQISFAKIRIVLEAYSLVIGFRQRGANESGDMWDKEISEIISKDFKSFVKWFKANKQNFKF